MNSDAWKCACRTAFCVAGLSFASGASANTAAQPVPKPGEHIPLNRCDQSRDYMAARELLRLAIAANDKRDFSKANAFADLGLAKIDSFVAAETTGREDRFMERIDDSVAALVDAQKLAKSNQLEYAASMKLGILDERISVYGPGVLCK